ncbi:TrbG/VirB9 family P-type conjugative transfer protein (plasmid) [Acinetobacter lwoffii]|jgi:type IV secretion system protein VirB9|uniref:P-type conjugative transfer protein VirB9 n=7 Tax=Acinetobacter TaxID=469 RepID=N9FXW5_ACILW|nr:MULTISPECIES: TrbG/VirB9 family P-type conjugative transfer protein [Acinetobacter]HAZ8114342.1 TrbG/VirB9 family P-type conjugative transfer protein [Escherichia coli]EET83863.1 putative P-type conjugative transfer protein VirB9 [Acinetobacter radioresistens SK82]EHU3217652.1 TrbG/VirB9 family P-type conjugative transfer protein [Acinetobacter baumannii]EJO33849.1 putative P-type conjugative transfer protein VirB9 [Acinetobacter radioresistens WC-A-157]ELA8727649.1 TrbG/VirB9 family P-type
MKKTLISILLAATCIASAPSFAKQIPVGLKTDGRIKTVPYSENHVVELSTTFGISTVVEFGNETIQTVASGDTIGWQIIPQGNRLFVKPAEKPQAGMNRTNLTVITDKRNYYFNLFNSSQPVYVLRFNYADVNKTNRLIAQQNAPKRALGELPMTSIKWGMDATHSKSIKVLGVSDDDQFTFIRLGKNSPRPAVYAVNGEGYEELTNSRQEGDVIVIESVSDAFTLRLGNEYVCILRKPNVIGAK